MSWQDIRKQVLDRDGNTCQGCGSKTRSLDVHHIIPRQKQGLDSLNNLVAVCEKCHSLIELANKRPTIVKVIKMVGNKIRFAGKLNRMKDNRVIWIPKTYLDQLKDFTDEQLLITIELEKIK